jgi:outer membrane protein OmpA-like peptidoglycan-associated protein
VDGKLTTFEKIAPIPLPGSAPPNPMVFFDIGSTMLTPQAEQVLERVVQDYEAVRGSATVVIIACTDGSEAQSHSADLSQRRGEAVKNRLVALGIPGDRIEVLARGDSTPLLIAPPGTAEPQNRRVEIWVRRT